MTESAITMLSDFFNEPVHWLLQLPVSLIFVQQMVDFRKCSGPGVETWSKALQRGTEKNFDVLDAGTVSWLQICKLIYLKES